MIPADKIAIVTGIQRTGTSCVMQTLDKLGVPISGDKWPVDRTKKRTEANPKGYYELQPQCHSGADDWSPWYGTAVKVFDTALPTIDKRDLWAMVLCVRHPASMIASDIRCGTTYGARGGWLTKARRLSGFVDFLERWRYDRLRTLVVDYDDMIDNPVEVVGQLCDLFKIDPTSKQEQTAVTNIDSKLRRAKSGVVKKSAVMSDGHSDRAIRLYEKLRTFTES